jgi:hypothetical protein
VPAGYVRTAFESIPGNEANTPTLSTKKLFHPLQSLGPKLNPKPLHRDDELRNQDEPLAVVPDSYEPGWELKERAYPDALGFLLAWIFGKDATLGYAVTAGNGIITDPDTTAIPVGATRHVWTAPFGPSGARPLTAQIDAAYKDQTYFRKLKGAACSELSIRSPEEGVQVKNQ